MAGYTVERSTVVNATPERLHRLVADLHEWPAWSPWEDVDPDLRREYSGPDSGVGARYEWAGNRKAGRGTMLVTGSEPEAVEIRIDFHKPIRSTSTTRFSFQPGADGTLVRWVMTGQQTGLMGVLGKVVSMDRLIGPDFEKGLARLRVVAEAS